MVQMAGLKGLISLLGSTDREWSAKRRGFAGGLVGRWTRFVPREAGMIGGREAEASIAGRTRLK